MNISHSFNVAGLQFVTRMVDIDLAQKEAAAMSQVAGKKALRSGMRALLRVLRRGLLKRLPARRTGKLRRSIRTKITIQNNSRVTGKISLGAGGAFYARILEGGSGTYGPKSRPYAVRAKNKKAISFPGARHPVQSVQIKGIKPRHMVRNTEQSEMNAARRAFNEAFERDVRGVLKVFKQR